MKGKHTTRWLGMLLAVCMTAALVPMTAATVSAAPAGTSTIDWNDVRQYVDGFGGAYAFNKAGSVMRLPEATREKVLDMVFSRENGINLSILRLIVGDGSKAEWGSDYDGPADTIEPSQGVFVWDDPNWAANKADFDKYQVWIAQEAAERGCDTILASVWSPPSWMKTSGNITNGALRTDMYQAFADYLSEYVLGYDREFGIGIDYISIANEPTHTGSYSSCTWTASQFNVFIRDYLGPTFAARGVTAGIVMPEHMSYGDSLAVAALQDPVTLPYIDVMATHLYGLNVGNVTATPIATTLATQAAQVAAGQPAVKIWQTEYMNQGDPAQTFANNTISDGLKWGKLIADMFTTAKMNAYFWWWPAANNGADGSDLIRLCNDGSPQAAGATENGLYRVFKRYYAFGNYSRFIDTGYQVVGATKTPAAGVTVTAYKDPATGNFTIVAVNSNTTDTEIAFNLSGFPGGIGSVVPYRTSASENLKKLGDIAVDGTGFTTVLKAGSVTTFIPKANELPGLADEKDVFSTYEAEENDGQPATATIADLAAGKGLAGLRNGDSIRYGNVNFADGSANGTAAKRYILSLYARVASLAGGTIEVRIDDPVDGKLVGAMSVLGLNDPARMVDLSTMIDTNKVDGAYGFHDLYLVFKGIEGYDLFVADSFVFNDGNLASAIGANLLTNPGFESSGSSATGWARSSGSTGSTGVVATPVLAGIRAGRFYNRPADAAVGISQSVLGKLVNGVTYEVSGYFRPYNATFASDTAQIYLRVTTAAGVTNVPLASANLASTANWVQTRGTFTYADPGGVTALQLVYTTGLSATTFYLDETVLRELLPATAATVTGTEGNPGWYRSNITLSLDPTPASAALSGIRYRVDGGDWTAYTGPMAFSSGIRTVEWFGIAETGAWELPQSITLRVEAVFGGFQSPLGKLKSFKSGSTIPVKFGLSDFNGMPFNDATAVLEYALLTDGAPGAWMPAAATGGTATDNGFRLVDGILYPGQFQFNFKTVGLAAGDYRLKATLNDGNAYTFNITIK